MLIIRKVCSRCKREKNKNEFHKNRKCKDGVNSVCKSCVKNNYLNNKEAYKKRDSKWRLNNKKKRVGYVYSWRKDNRKKYLQARKRYYEKNAAKLILIQWHGYTKFFLEQHPVVLKLKKSHLKLKQIHKQLNISK